VILVEDGLNSQRVARAWEWAGYEKVRALQKLETYLSLKGLIPNEIGKEQGSFGEH